MSETESTSPPAPVATETSGSGVGAGGGAAAGIGASATVSLVVCSLTSIVSIHLPKPAQTRDAFQPCGALLRSPTRTGKLRRAV